MPLWKKGEHTIKQPVYVADVAGAVVAAIRDPDTAGKVYQAIGYVLASSSRRWYCKWLFETPSN